MGLWDKAGARSLGLEPRARKLDDSPRFVRTLSSCRVPQRPGARLGSLAPLWLLGSRWGYRHQPPRLQGLKPGGLVPMRPLGLPRGAEMPGATIMLPCASEAQGPRATIILPCVSEANWAAPGPIRNRNSEYGVPPEAAGEPWLGSQELGRAPRVALAATGPIRNQNSDDGVPPEATGEPFWGSQELCRDPPGEALAAPGPICKRIPNPRSRRRLWVSPGWAPSLNLRLLTNWAAGPPRPDQGPTRARPGWVF